jgi:hypothetical protein
MKRLGSGFVGLVMAIACSPVSAQKAASAPGGHWAHEAVVALQARNILPAGKSVSSVDGNKPVTRYELAVVLWKLVRHMEAAGKQPRGKGTASRELDAPSALRRLIADGYIDPQSAMAKDPKGLVGEDELAKALVGVVARIQEKNVPVTPDSKRSIPIERHPSGGS